VPPIRTTRWLSPPTKRPPRPPTRQGDRVEARTTTHRQHTSAPVALGRGGKFPHRQRTTQQPTQPRPGDAPGASGAVPSQPGTSMDAAPATLVGVAAAPTTSDHRLPRARRCWRRGAVPGLPQRQQLSPTTSCRSSPACTPQPRHARGQPGDPITHRYPHPRARHTTARGHSHPRRTGPGGQRRHRTTRRRSIRTARHRPNHDPPTLA
jgi:hypothetical protein